MRLSEVKAVSVAEKKAERITRITRAAIILILAGSNIRTNQLNFLIKFTHKRTALSHDG